MKNKNRFFSLWLSLTCIGVFILQIIFNWFNDIFSLGETALKMPWQFLTAIFLHGSITHLIFNLFALIMFGLILEQVIGSKKFLIVFFISGILANIISWIWFPNALGASGAIMGIIGCLAVIRPLMSVWAFGMIVPMFIAALLWIGESVFGVLGLGDQGIGYLAHLVGLVIGLIFGLYIKFSKPRKGQVIFERKIKVPESYMRSWENVYMTDR